MRFQCSAMAQVAVVLMHLLPLTHLGANGLIWYLTASKNLKLDVAASLDAILLRPIKNVTRTVRVLLSRLEWLSFGCPPRKGCRQIQQLWCHREWIRSSRASYSLEIVLSACTSHRLLVALANEHFGVTLRSHQSDSWGLVLFQLSMLHCRFISGLMFGATYTIYDIIDVFPERHKLIKLRNPAGHRDISEV